MAKSFNVGEVVFHDDVGECIIKEVQNFKAFMETENGKEEVCEMDQAAMLVLVYDGGEFSASPDQIWTREEWQAFWGQDRTKMFGRD